MLQYLLYFVLTNNCTALFLGSGRVSFSSRRSYMKAVQAAFVEIKTPKFTKKVTNKRHSHFISYAPAVFVVVRLNFSEVGLY